MGNGRAAALLILLMVVSPLLLGVSSGTPTSTQYHFTRAASPHVETVLGWMIVTSASKALQSVAVPGASQEEVLAYFELTERYREANQFDRQSHSTGPARTASLPADPIHLRQELSAFEPAVERRIQQQVSEALRETGAGWHTPVLDAVFPPVVFRFQPPPKLLVVSPRDRIERSATVLVDARLTRAEVDDLEASVAGTAYSTLVTAIGGLGVYPSMLPESSNARWVLDTVAHEWAHHYLALRPLGWRYAFGAETDERMRTLNETVADIVGREIGEIAFPRWYDDVPAVAGQSSSPRQDEYRGIMRELRLRVDALLAEGKIEEAESAMEETRQDLVRRGYALRKINQAFFAFHGSYAADPFMAGAQGEDISARVHALRAESSSLGDFLWRISGAGSYQEFDAIAPRP
jgi:hypothetical protein